MSKKKKKYLADNKVAKVDEPEVSYRYKTIRFFSSLEEAEDADAEECAKFSPEENLAQATEFIERIFANKLKRVKKPYRNIFFTKYAYID